MGDSGYSPTFFWTKSGTKSGYAFSGGFFASKPCFCGAHLHFFGFFRDPKIPKIGQNRTKSGSKRLKKAKKGPKSAKNPEKQAHNPQKRAKMEVGTAKSVKIMEVGTAKMGKSGKNAKKSQFFEKFSKNTKNGHPRATFTLGTPQIRYIHRSCATNLKVCHNYFNFGQLLEL